MGDTQRGATPDNGSLHVHRLRLNLEHRHREWLAELRSKQTRSRSIPFFDEELLQECDKLVGGNFCKMQGVYLPTKAVVPSHPHDATHTVIYMPMDHECRLDFTYLDISYPTEAGYAVIIPRGEWHSVNFNEWEPRFVIATLYRV